MSSTAFARQLDSQDMLKDMRVMCLPFTHRHYSLALTSRASPFLPGVIVVDWRMIVLSSGANNNPEVIFTLNRSPPRTEMVLTVLPRWRLQPSVSHARILSADEVACSVPTRHALGHLKPVGSEIAIEGLLG